jgi:hypothetical protein
MKGSGRKIRASAGALTLAMFTASVPLLSGTQTGAVREIQVRMSIGAGGPEAPSFVPFRPEIARLAIRDQRTLPGSLPRQRRLELSEDLLVIVALDLGGNEAYRTSLPDPRLLRAETADEAGNLSSIRLYRESVDFWIALPDRPDLDRVVLHHPEWTGTVFHLVPIAEVKLR